MNKVTKKSKEQKRHEDILLNLERHFKHMNDYYAGKIDLDETMRRMIKTKPKPKL